MNRREFLKTAATAAVGITGMTSSSAETKSSTSPILLEAKHWSQLPGLLHAYEEMVDKGDGISRLFGYASLITDHEKEKPTGSRALPNEKARLKGMEVAMNVLAAGEYEFRGTRGTYMDGDKKKRFANIGVYAGLESAADANGYADGKNITASKSDRRESLKAYIARELGNPPAGITLDDLFDPAATMKFVALLHTPEDNLGMYKFLVAEVDIDGTKKAPAVTVATNEESKFAAIGLTPMQTAQLVLDGHGYVRNGGRGGTALDYFKKSVIGVAQKNNLHQPRLEAIDRAVDELAGIYSEAYTLLSKQGLPENELAQEFNKLIDKHPALTGDDNLALKTQRAREGKPTGVYSPYFKDGENVNQRDPVSDADKALPQNAMEHTAEQKFARIERLRKEGATAPGYRER